MEEEQEEELLLLLLTYRKNVCVSMCLHLALCSLGELPEHFQMLTLCLSVESFQTHMQEYVSLE